jgi:hypothetical protein
MLDKSVAADSCWLAIRDRKTTACPKVAPHDMLLA